MTGLASKWRDRFLWGVLRGPSGRPQRGGGRALILPGNGRRIEVIDELGLNVGRAFDVLSVRRATLSAC